MVKKRKPTTPEEARYFSDVDTIEKNISVIEDNENIPYHLERILDMLIVLPENWEKWKKQKKKWDEEEEPQKDTLDTKDTEEENPEGEITFVDEFLKKEIKYNSNGEVCYDENNKVIYKSIKVDIDKFVGHLITSFHFKTIFGSKSEDIFVYEKGIYSKNGRAVIQTQTEKILKSYSTNYNVREIQEKIKRLSAINKDDFENTPEELICLENGVLNLRSRKLENHNPKYYFRTKLPIEYNEKADCPKIKKFFNDVLYEEDIPVMQEWFGYNLWKRYFIKKAMITFGKKDTGKTIMLNLLMAFLNKKNTSGISLQRISSGDKFALSSLKDKMANVFDDLSSKDLTDEGGFKIATGGGFITAEYKFGDSFQFLNYAKHIFATNKIPPVEDVEDDAYYDRWIPIPFDNQIEKKDQDKFLLDKLTTKKELSGLLNYVLKGLKRLLKNGVFSYKKTSREIKVIMERHSNSLSAFVQDVLVEKEGNRISKDDMFNIYSIYVNDRKLSKLSKTQLGRRLPKYAPYILAKIDKIRFWENADITSLHININTYNALQKIICGEIKGNNNIKSNNMYINSRETLKALGKHNKNNQEKLDVEVIKI